MPELDEEASWRLVAMGIACIGGLWAHARPSPSVLAAYEADPALAVMRVDFTTELERTMATLISGTLARTPAEG
ncbi:hypothetical protein [Spirillospora sp. NPDC047279]|uniref:hypothetical protein n=1 Tax=Spirillospora sp. NPDC047279 TaxID=3155478 RepID=UPI00341059DE